MLRVTVSSDIFPPRYECNYYFKELVDHDLSKLQCTYIDSFKIVTVFSKPCDGFRKHP